MSFPFLEIARSVLETAPQVAWNPATGVRFLFYWAITLLVYSQYARTARLQKELYGTVLTSPFGQTLASILQGVVVGAVGSFVMTFIGVAFLPDGGGLVWLMPTALALMLINVRLMCFSYAGGLLALSYLLFGFPKVSIPPLMALVAVLHLMESLLILLDGSAGATPVYLQRRGRTVGAFYLQRAWSVPVALLILAVISPAAAKEGIAMPDWWPVLRTAPEILAHPGAVFFPHALPAALGYGEVALTSPPGLKARRTAVNLALYSLTLLALSVAATRVPLLLWVTALFAPLGHEAVVRLENRRESAGRPYFIPPGEGLMVLDVVPGTPAERLGLGPGWVITEVGGRPVTGRAELEEALTLARASGRLYLTVRPPRPSGDSGPTEEGPDGWDGTRGHTFSCPFGPGSVLGVIPVPEPGDRVVVELAGAGPLGGLARRLAGRSGSGGS